MREPGAKRFPTLPLFGAGALIVVALLAASVARVSDVGTTRVTYDAPLEQRDLLFADRSNGAVAVHAAGSGELIALMEPGSNGFVRIVMRGLARERLANGVGEGPPFTLTRWTDGRLTISDPTTDRTIALTGFGKDNVHAFAKLLLARSDAK
jgi:putative photosynthetic complex assembly protein